MCSQQRFDIIETDGYLGTGIAKQSQKVTKQSRITYKWNSLKLFNINCFEMAKLNQYGVNEESILALKPLFGVFRMEKQSVVNFKVKAKERLVYSLLCGLGLASLSLSQFVLNLGSFIFIISSLVAGVGAMLFVYATRSPIILFTDDGFYYKPALLSNRAYYMFDEIQFILPSGSNDIVHFQLEDGQTVHIHLKHLNQKDHIRFIFLLESDVNRKHVLKSIASHTKS